MSKKRLPSDPAAINEWMAGLSREELAELTRAVLGGELTGSLRGMAALEEATTQEIDLAPPPDEPSLLTLTIELRGSKPRIWRRLSLPGNLTLDEVHPLFQAAMGWTNSHLHHFQPGAGRTYESAYFLTEFDIEEGDEGTPETDVRLDQVLRARGDRLTYLYDFGDDWEHRVTLESLTPLTPDNREPACLAGAKACPPEDVGGIHGHQELAAWLRSGAPADEVPEPFDDAEHAHDWLPVHYDPDEFDVAETTEAMRRWAGGEHLPWHGVPDGLAGLVQRLRGGAWMTAVDWLAALGPRRPVHLDEDEARVAARPWRAILDAIASGAQLTSAGHLPPTVVEQIARDSGITDWWIGKANREDLTPPVAILRDSAQRIGLVRKVKGRLVPTARARAAAGDPRTLVAAVLERLPLGTGYDADASWCYLLGIAAGAAHDSLDNETAAMLADLGWRHRDGSALTAWEARHGAVPTIEALESMAGVHRDIDAALVVKLARATLLGLDTTP